MSEIQKPKPVKLICGVLISPEVDVRSLESQIEASMGLIEDRSPVFGFTYTDYYQKEMGDGLSKYFLSFQSLIDPGSLSRLKVSTNEIEKNYSTQGKRNINLDPGYITAAKLVLASTKNFAHRIYLALGIYGDVQLRFRQGKFVPSDWTYPDYRTDLAMFFFQKVRARFMEQENDYEESDSI